jgi:RNA polymerase sigma factor (sigma-70 family)
VLTGARTVHNFAGCLPRPLSNRYCRFVLPSPPSPAESARLKSSEDVIDLRSQAPERWAEDATNSEMAAKPSGAPALREAAAEARPATALVNQEASEDVHHSSNAAAGSAVRSSTVAALVEKARQGEAGAWEELVARFGGMIAATGRRYRLTPSDVGELQQTTWLRLVENLHRIEQPERVGGWLATTARRESLQLLRRAGKYHSGADQMLANMPDKHLPEPDARPIAEERETVLRAGWGRLKPRCQELLSLLISDDPVGYKDLSKLLQMPVGSIGPTRARCLEHLRRLVEEEGMAGIRE